ncbi:MAG TPA: SIS domain-containing protein [Patescibacteria group bacterium]|nr:SIS domain-containing protein [Patescibacteria group bacterium]
MDLDNHSKFLEELDPGQVGDSIACLPDQISQILEDAEAVDIPASHKDVDKVVLNGMGGSNLGARIIQSLFEKELSVPVIITPGYIVPGYVDDKTLFIFSSYSGGTEEPLSVFPEVRNRKAKMIGVTSSHEDNKLEKLMSEQDFPGFAFKPRHNPSGQPRLGLGYSIFSILAVLDKLGLIHLDRSEVEEAIKFLKEKNKSWRPEIETGNNRAKEIAQELKGRIPVLIGAEFLEGNLHTFRNQMCENSKNFADYLTLPDLNHFLLEGLAHPAGNKDNLAFLFLDSDQYSPEVRTRSKLTKQTVEKNGIKTLEYRAESGSRLGQSLEILQLGAWITFYFSIINEEDPSLIPWVDWFKKKLKE